MALARMRHFRLPLFAAGFLGLSLCAASPVLAAADSPASGIGSYRGFGPAVAKIVFGDSEDGAEYGFERGQPERCTRN